MPTSWRRRHFHSKSPKSTQTALRSMSLPYSRFLVPHRPTLHPKLYDNRSAPKLKDPRSRSWLFRPTLKLSLFLASHWRWRFKLTRFTRNRRDLHHHIRPRVWLHRHQLSYHLHPKHILSLWSQLTVTYRQLTTK